MERGNVKKLYRSVETRVPVWIKCARENALGMMLNHERTPPKSCSVNERACESACVPVYVCVCFAVGRWDAIR